MDRLELTGDGGEIDGHIRRVNSSGKTHRCQQCGTFA
jgi:hypothetical protein